ncbi:MAG: hypothetical protein A3H64_00695 [Candidatus Ryanbacteria bacterium RIFCSPLOWO2_02_FULL_45_11c]|uniref:Adenylate kinase n=1 Tax=Candidatus Ryanbacteria bacterium RIFCSPLOWO2_02_FULL_45_11c TaxID=1802128 RepID=A0A1G2GX70_9BACT|nr:MAG: hypothetical protein A3H64_00695 [Candidatus Ryanbacteria bacterium RIFCSPLOWO2_02_FULL_45_11c]
MEKPLNIIFLGLSGSGKGTQVQLLADVMRAHNPVHVVSTGDLFRRLQEFTTDVGKRVKRILQEGGLPFDDLATTLWMHEIAFRVHEHEGIIFDGAPRRLDEAKNIDRFLEFLERKEYTKVAYLSVTPEEITKRLLQRGRADDNITAIEGRIDYFQKSVLPVLDYYREQGRLIEISGEQPVEKVHADIVKALGL